MAEAQKFGYIFVVAMCALIDCLLKFAGAYLGLDVPNVPVFTLLAACWYILNECLSIIENVGRMGAPVPVWIAKYIAVLKNKIDQKGEEDTREN